MQKRVYMVCKNAGKRDYIVGVFTTLENVYNVLKELSLKNCYINNKKEITVGSLTTSFKGRGLTIYRKQKYLYKILQIKMNQVNPYLKQVLKQK